MAVSRINEAGLNVNQYGNRNLVINGGMQVAQRGNFTITTSGSAEYGGPDRFFMWTYTSTEQVVADISQATDVPSGQGFGYSYKVDVTTAESAVAAGEALLINQYIEAQNVQQLEYGTSSAKDVTVSFWIKSTKTGTYCFSLNQPDANRVYVKEYTVDASDTWEKKIITIPGDASGTINNDNGRGLWLQWVLMAGSDRQGTANNWRGDPFDLATSNQVNAVDNASNNIYLTGVQLEVGDTATDFEHRSYGDELARCQRYFYSVTAGADNTSVAVGAYYTATAVYATVFFPVTMRNNPSLISSNTSGHFHIFRNGNVDAFAGWSGLQNTGLSQSTIYVGSGPNSTTGSACWVETNDTAAITQFNAEL